MKMKMKTKTKATRLPPSSKDEKTPPTAAFVNTLLENRIASSVLTTNTIEPHSTTKKAVFDDVIVRRSKRIRKDVPQHPVIRIADPEILIIDTTDSEQNVLGNPAQCFLDQNLNQSQIEDIELEQQNQHPARSEKGREDNDSSEDNSAELEPEEPMNDKSKGSKNKSEMWYRTMYLESQKEVLKLTDANNELSKKLAVAEGKLQVYETGSGILASIIDRTKDIFMASALSNATDQAFPRTTSRAKPKRKTNPASKKKKPVAKLG